MSRILLSVLALAFAVDTASADIPPPPGARERAYAAQIIAAGHACAEPVTFKELTGKRAKELQEQGLYASRVTCKGGKSYLVANPPRARPWLRPSGDAPAKPRPEPIVEPMR